MPESVEWREVLPNNATAPYIYKQARPPLYEQIMLGKIAFLTLTLVAAAVSVVATTPLLVPVPTVAESAELVVFCFICFVAILGMAFGIADREKPEALALAIAVGCLVTSLHALLLLPAPIVRSAVHLPSPFFPQYVFWFSLVGWSIAAFVSTADEVDEWPGLLLAFSAVGTMVALFCRTGEIALLSYAIEPLKEARTIHTLLDVRLIIGCLLSILILGTAVGRASAKPLPKLPVISLVQMAKLGRRVPSLVIAFLEPFRLVINASLRILIAVSNVLWKAPAITVVFFYRVGLQLALLIVEMLMRRQSLIRFLRVCAAFVLIIGATVVAALLVRPGMAYLASATWSAGVSTIGLVASWGLALFLLVLTIVAILRPERDLGQDYVFGVSFVLAVFVTAGLLLHLLSWWGILQVQGFGGISPFSAVLFSILVLGFAALWLGRLGREKTVEAIAFDSRTRVTGASRRVPSEPSRSEKTLP